MDILSQVSEEDIQDLFLNLNFNETFSYLPHKNILEFVITLKETNKLNRIIPPIFDHSRFAPGGGVPEKFDLGNLLGCIVTRITEHRHYYSYEIAFDNLDLDLKDKPIYVSTKGSHWIIENSKNESRVIGFIKGIGGN